MQSIRSLAIQVFTNKIIIPSLRSLSHLTEVKSNVIMQVAAGTVAPAILLTNPFVEDEKTKEYSAIKQVIAAVIGLFTQLIISIPVDRAIDDLALRAKIPYQTGSKKIDALKLIVGAALVTTTAPLYAYLVNKLLPKVMEFLKGKNKENDDDRCDTQDTCFVKIDNSSYLSGQTIKKEWLG